MAAEFAGLLFAGHPVVVTVQARPVARLPGEDRCGTSGAGRSAVLVVDPAGWAGGAGATGVVRRGGGGVAFVVGAALAGGCALVGAGPDAGRAVVAHPDRTRIIASRSAAVTHRAYLRFTATCRATYVHR